jgi:hypothetical protein
MQLNYRLIPIKILIKTIVQYLRAEIDVKVFMQLKINNRI